MDILCRTDTIELLELSFEYALVGAFNFGAVSGTGRITVGVYIRVGASGLFGHHSFDFTI